MIIQLHPKFKTAYKKRITYSLKLVSKTGERIKLFKENSRNPVLKDHALIGRLKNLRSFSVSGDIRIVYQQIGKERVLFLDIGSHNQVY